MLSMLRSKIMDMTVVCLLLLKARLWIHSLIQKYEAPKSKRPGLSQEKLLSYNKKVQSYETIIQIVPVNAADCTTILQRIQMICKHSKDWTLCSTTTCKGDPQYRDEYILCVICRRWFHLKCTKSAVRLVNACTDYHKCQMCPRQSS